MSADVNWFEDGDLDIMSEQDGNQQAATPADSEAQVLEADLRKLQEERDQLFERVARVQADFTNAQRRLESEKQNAIQFANAKLIQSLIPAIDDFERAMGVDPAKTDSAAILKGLQLVHEKLIKALKEQHVEIIEPHPGTPFDPNLHQALMQQKDERYTEPTVTQLVQKGYAVYGRTLRPAQVVVSA